MSGIVVDEDQNPLSAVLVFNMKTEEKTYTNFDGEFIIKAIANEELRFVRKGFERNSTNVNQQNLNVAVKVILIRSIQEIEEVTIAYQPTGDLVKDEKNYGDTKLVAKMKLETAEYIRSESSPEVLAPKPGEFVQPVGPGFSGGSIKNQWDDVDFMEFLIENIGQDFFTDDLRLTKSEIQPFIYYVFRNFPRKRILFRGICTQYDLSRFTKEAYLKIESYRKNLPNSVSPKKK
ncbi:carboxypeptidase-like regulatory domain-containing protein [Chryseobacterium sp. SNU WT5]|uniref:carboxypeptidase-like regulatory domain-containing protein n=1 Tax=Chryseobacterium sp. SNU WT5 TaxID=2594269 RepID=UPI00162319F6|nr:carboxypeptidase-like regulatory domain-containing protein [Chryseobacterium sp. SNU WT5]